MSIFEEEDFNIITDAALGHLGADQEFIAIEGLRVVKLLLQKNRDYGSSAWQPPFLCPSVPVGEALLVRMSDKVRRISQLTQASPQVATESLEDSIRDLAGYCLLYLARPTKG